MLGLLLGNILYRQISPPQRRQRGDLADHVCLGEKNMCSKSSFDAAASARFPRCIPVPKVISASTVDAMLREHVVKPAPFSIRAAL